MPRGVRGVYIANFGTPTAPTRRPRVEKKTFHVAEKRLFETRLDLENAVTFSNFFEKLPFLKVTKPLKLLEEQVKAFQTHVVSKLFDNF